MSERLRELYTKDVEADFFGGMKRRFADPVRPQDAKGRFRPHPLLVLLMTFLCFALVTFFYFSYRQP